MQTRALIQSQYHAALDMLDEAIHACPQDLWTDPGFKNPFWHVAYHALFYTHLYLQERGETFTPWEHHRQEYEFLGAIPWDQNRVPETGEPYSKEEVLEFLTVCRQEVEQQGSAVDLEAESGFGWLPFDKLELQFYNIRHLQHHTGQLSERLRTSAKIGIHWVSHHPQEAG